MVNYLYNNKNLTKQKEFLYYFVTTLLIIHIASSIIHTPFYTKVVFAILFILFIISNNLNKIEVKFIFLILYIFIILLIQGLQFGIREISSIISVLVTFTIPYLALKIVGPEIITKYYVKVMFVFTLISFCFYFPLIIFPEFYNTLRYIAINFHIPNMQTIFINESIIIYNIGMYKGVFLENPGPFWEGGGFATFIALAMIINTFKKKSMIDKTNLVFMIGLITTFSTAGVLFLMVYILYSVTYLNRNSIFKVLLIPLTIILGIFVFNNFELLGPKIKDRYQAQTSINIHTPTAGRFLGLRKDLISISRHPMFGRGLSWETRADYTSDERGDYTFISVAARMGIIAFAFYFIFLFRYFKIYKIVYNTRKNYDYFAFFALLILMFTQSVEFSSIFLILIYTSFIYNNQILLNYHPD